ncbi:MFS transporter [Staphylococcus pasteuri]|uniref:MFS transporter n=1 Tax=Staphylococcus pasteuri TaxID=45972 RepID=UPI001F263950|nr:MFS transporter [Staphylococcus pasteuri]MCF7600945.1 MFS transporter [Staphylococcus pasteuri]
MNKIWTKEFIGVSLMNFLLTLIFFLLNAIIALYAVSQLDSSSNMAGLTVGIFIIGALLGRLIINPISEKYGNKMVLKFGLIITVITTATYLLGGNINILYLIRFFNGISIGITTTIVASIVALIIPNEKRGEGISYFAVSTALATGIGPFIGIFLTQITSFDVIFIIVLAISILTILISLFIKLPEVKPTDNKKLSFSMKNLIEKKAIPIGLLIFIMTFTFSSIMTYINLYAVEINLVKSASFFFVIYTITVLISRPFTGKVLDNKGAKLVLIPAIISFALGLLLLSLANNSFILLLSGAFIGLGFGNVSSISQTLAVKTVSSEKVGLATATFFIFFDLGNGLGPIILGNIISIGYANMYMLLSTIIFIVGIIFMLFSKKIIKE